MAMSRAGAMRNWIVITGSILLIRITRESVCRLGVIDCGFVESKVVYPSIAKRYVFNIKHVPERKPECDTHNRQSFETCYIE